MYFSIHNYQVQENLNLMINAFFNYFLNQNPMMVMIYVVKISLYLLNYILYIINIFTSRSRWWITFFCFKSFFNREFTCNSWKMCLTHIICTWTRNITFKYFFYFNTHTIWWNSFINSWEWIFIIITRTRWLWNNSLF